MTVPPIQIYAPAPLGPTPIYALAPDAVVYDTDPEWPGWDLDARHPQCDGCPGCSWVLCHPRRPGDEPCDCPRHEETYE